MKTITIRIFSAFAGIDTQYMAFRRWLNNLNVKGCRIVVKMVGWCEIDPHAIASHNALFPDEKKYHYPDITAVDWASIIEEIDVFIYSSCCQSITRAGAQKGMTEGSGTPSSLIWYVRDAIRIKKPKVCILENVPALLENKFVGQFEKWTDTVEELGYRNTWSTLCAANYGVPQNRNRVFLVSLREDLKKRVYFPTPFGCKNSAEQLLEEDVDEKYYFSNEETMNFLLNINNKASVGNRFPCITGKGVLTKKKSITPSCKGYDKHVCTTLVADKNYMKGNYEKLLSSTHFPRPGVLEVWEQHDSIKMSYEDVISNAPQNEKRKFKIMNGSIDQIQKQIKGLAPNEYFRLRWLTPGEWFRFMGIEENDINILRKLDNPDYLYKEAGNAIVVNVLEKLYESIFSDIMDWWDPHPK